MKDKIDTSKFILLDAKYNQGIMIHEYKGNYYIASAKFDKERGEADLLWMFPRDIYTKKPKQTPVPLAIRVGTKEQMIKALLLLLETMGVNLVKEE
jgi:hypothetical protein